jgi:hypothetical protein
MDLAAAESVAGELLGIRSALLGGGIAQLMT